LNRADVNWIFTILIVGAVLTASLTGTMGKVTEGSIASAKSAVELTFSLVAQMTLWLGLMGIVREAGLLAGLARALGPLMRRLFPEVPPEHPAMGAMILNLAANILGLGNAATPFGLKAMAELDTLNPRKGVASNAMALFLVINTSGVAVLPLGVIAVRATLGSKDAAGIVVPSIVGTLLSTAVAVLLCKALQRLPRFAAEKAAAPVGQLAAKPIDEAALAQAQASAQARQAAPAWRTGIAALVGVGLLAAAALSVVRSEQTGFEAFKPLLGDWVLPGIMVLILLVGFAREVKVYEVFIPAAKEGFQVGVTILPYLVAILVAVGMFRASGALEWITSGLQPALAAVGFPADALPMALIRPLSGNGALGVMTETMKAKGPDSFVGYLVSLINGSSETTFYVLSLYFGAVGVRAVRHTLAACLLSDAVGLGITTALCHLFFGGAR
jgi:spore maturation protein SpmA/spore maturation protein SpmB